MSEHILTIVSKDRAGIVKAVSHIIAEHHGSWVDSAMSRLGGAFAGVVRVQFPEDQAHDGLQALSALMDQGIDVRILDGSPHEESAAAYATLSLVGQDHVGIVAKVTHALVEAGIRVEQLETSVFSGSMSGEAMFQAKATLALPDEKALDQARDSLEDLAADLMVELDLHKPGHQLSA